MNCHGNMKLYRALHHKNRRVIFKDVMWKDELCFFGLMISLRAVHNTNSGKRWDISLPIQQFLFPHLTVIGTMKQTTIIYINSWRTSFPCMIETATECKTNFEDFELPSIVREMVDISRKCIFVVSFITTLIISQCNHVTTQLYSSCHVVLMLNVLISIISWRELNESIHVCLLFTSSFHDCEYWNKLNQYEVIEMPIWRHTVSCT